MKKWSLFLLIGLLFMTSYAKDPFRTSKIEYVAYFMSRYRGMCVATQVSRTVLLTAAACVLDTKTFQEDRRPITVVVGSNYRHPRRGIRVPITKIVVPTFPESTVQRAYLIEKSVAYLLMKKRLPDVLTENPIRAVPILYNDISLALHEQCFTLGWHYHYEGDKIYPLRKFLLQRNLRAQNVNIVKMNDYCKSLQVKLMLEMARQGNQKLGLEGSILCTRDPENMAQPCHGMFGAPLVCRQKVVGMLATPTAQWANCTGMSNIFITFDDPDLELFFNCTKVLLSPEIKIHLHNKEVEDDTDPIDSYDFTEKISDPYVRPASEESDDDGN